jgi:hypothetical protein
MISHRKIAISVGILFIIATISPLISAIPLSGVPLGFESVSESNYLATIAANESQILIGALLLIVMTAAIVSIPILLYPILKKHNETFALGYVVARIFEGFFSAFNIIALLVLLSLSLQFVSITSSALFFDTSGSLILSAINWGSLLLDFPFTISAIVLNYVLYKSRLIPRWLSMFGLIGGSLWFAAIPLRMFSLFGSSLEFLAFPIFAQEMIFAGYLIIKGFNLRE